ncbi:hypothetical protein BH10ACI2_BH10ACI2_00420 [soil metagenome]
MESTQTMKRTRKMWTKDQLEEFRGLYPDTPTEDLARHLDRTILSLYAAAGKYGIHKSEAYLAEKKRLEAERLRSSGAVYRFPKGNQPANKGKKNPVTA